jgi:hypothetical protein
MGTIRTDEIPESCDPGGTLMSTDGCADLLRRVRRLWDDMGMPVPERHDLAEVMVRTFLTFLGINGRYVEIKRKWSAAIGFEVQLPQ